MELNCPITLELFEDPITTPQCGHTFSRMALYQHLQNSNYCPVCRTDISDFDSLNAPKSINIAYLVDQHKNCVNQPLENLYSPIESKWIATISKIYNPINEITLGKLNITNSDENLISSQFKTMIIPVIDESGSMGGNPFKQAAKSLKSILKYVYNKKFLESIIIKYESYAKSIPINKLNPIQTYDSEIDNFASGGTSFKAAFDEIIKNYNIHKTDPSISSFAVIFLTDGDDSRAMHELECFKQKLDKSKPIIFHSIGFGSSHNYELLNNISKLGTQDGAYRYADQNENDEILFNKIMSVIDVITKNIVIPIEINKFPDGVKLIKSDYPNYWINISNITDNIEFDVSINGEIHKIIPTFLGEEMEESTWNEWYKNLIDDIASEIIIINKYKLPDEKLDKTLHIQLLKQRIKSILPKLTEISEIERLKKLSEIINSNSVFDEKKLNDIKFEGKYTTAKISNNVILDKNTLDNKFTQPKISWYNHILKIPKPDKFDAPIYYHAYNGNLDELKKYHFTDFHDNCYNGYNIMDYAILHNGYYKTYDYLKTFGIKPSIDGTTLLINSLTNYYRHTAERLVNDNISLITDELISATPYVPAGNGHKSDTLIKWLQEHKNYDLYSLKDLILLQRAVSLTFHQNGISSYIIKKSNEKIKLSEFTLTELKQVLLNESIIKLLHQSNSINLNEIITYSDGTIVWPLFIACEKNIEWLFDLIFESNQNEVSSINQQNEKGVTCLWIAACNRNINIVMKLLELEADSSIVNYKGDGPLIPSIQKGNETIVNLLLDSSNNPSKLILQFNKNGDSPVLISCRTNQSKILDILLNKLNENQKHTVLYKFADIDGFNPLFASVEVDSTNCINVLFKHIQTKELANKYIELRTSKNNIIIANATALHLAARYGKLNSFKLLFKYNANINTTSNFGFNVLHLAIKYGHIDLCKFILSDKQFSILSGLYDDNGKLPEFYADSEFKNELFDTNFKNVIEDAINLNRIDIIKKYSTSIGCYDYKNLFELNLSNGLNVLSYFALNKNINYNEIDKKLWDLKDLSGISSRFWINLVNRNSKEDIMKFPEVSEQISRVEKSINRSLQNKILMKSIEPVTNSIIEEPINNIIELQPKLELDKINSKTKISLLQFVENIKNKKLIWEAKIHIIQMYALNQVDVGIEVSHIMAIYLYSSSQIIRNLNNKSHMQCLYQSLNILPPSHGELYKTFDNYTNYEIDEIINWPSFTICSYELKNSNLQLIKKYGIIFIIKTKSEISNCRYIGKYTKNQDEVIFLPQTKFKVTNFYKPNAIVLGQKNIRKTSYSANEKDIEKVKNKKSCIIIEILEL